MSPLLLVLVAFGALCLLGAFLYQNMNLFKRKRRRLPPVPIVKSDVLAESAPLRQRASVKTKEPLSASTSPTTTSAQKIDKTTSPRLSVDEMRRGSESSEGGHDGEPAKEKSNGKKRPLSKEEKRAKREIFKQKAAEKKQKKREKEEKELARLREELREEKERQEEEKKALEAERERQRRQEEEEAEAEKERIKEEKKREKERGEEEERKRRKEEDEQRARQAEIDRLKPASAWGGAAARQASAATAISIGATLSEAEKSGDQERLTQARNKVREERRKHRKLLLEARDKERALSEAEGLENGAKREKKAATDEETHKEAEEMKAALSWDDTLTMEVDRAGVMARVHGVPESAHAFVIGENGANIAVLKLLGAKVFLAESIAMEGYHEDLDSAFLKLKVLMQWKHFLDVYKKHRNALKNSAAGIVAEWSRGIASDLCFRYHNEGFGKCRLDLTGLHDDDALARFEARMDEIERIPISSLPSDSLEIIVGVPRAHNSVHALPLEKAICDYLTDFHFTHKVKDGKGSRIIRVQI